MKDKIADRYDRVASSAPVSKDAARTFSMRGEADLVCKPAPHHQSFVAPPPMVPPSPGQETYIGRKHGTFTVIGKMRAARWAVRCLCGIYEVRSTKAIDNASPDDRCRQCMKLDQTIRSAKRQAYFDRNGKWPPGGWPPRNT